MTFLENLSPEAYAAFWTITVAGLCGIMCALLGVWMVLQRVSLVGDAISHSVLPGLVLTFLWFGTREPIPMMIGATVAGVVTVFLTRLITQAVRVREDASLGVVFTILFAIGVVLITRYASAVDLDPGCVLYGLVEFVSLDTVQFAGTDIPRALINIVPTLIVSCIFLILFRKELALLSFDFGLASALGKRPNALYMALMAVVAMATVASFEAVGSILVIAMLIGPAAAAQLLTTRLRAMFTIAVLIAILSAILGYWLAARWNTSVAGMMSVVTGLCYVLSAFWSAALTRRGSARLRLEA
jgi:manganese/zinc/iron transport system permease protein